MLLVRVVFNGTYLYQHYMYMYVAITLLILLSLAFISLPVLYYSIYMVLCALLPQLYIDIQLNELFRCCSYTDV